jgi:hypothetical protein
MALTAVLGVRMDRTQLPTEIVSLRRRRDR